MPRITFNETLDFVKNLSRLADNVTTVMHLVGWQGSGHDTWFPTYDVVNPNLGSLADLQALYTAAQRYNTVISYHLNLDEAYRNLTAAMASNVSLHPVPGTPDGKTNADYIAANMAKTPSGEDWPWSRDSPGVRSDPLQGGAFHLSKTKDAASGKRWERLARFLDTIPNGLTLHSDAYRDINDSWEDDLRGFIAEDEEATCGLQADAEWLRMRGLSFGIEGPNGCLSAVGPVRVRGVVATVRSYRHPERFSPTTFSMLRFPG